MACHSRNVEHAHMKTRIGVSHSLLFVWILAVSEMVQAAPPTAADTPPQEGAEESNVTTAVNTR